MELTPVERAYLTEYLSRFGSRTPERVKFIDPTSELFDLQREVVEHLSVRKLLDGSRRLGKTVLSIAYALKVALGNPGCKVGYATKTREWAESLFWRPMIEWCEANGVSTSDFNNSKLQAVMPNGSIIRLASLRDRGHADVLRGHAYHVMILDEVQAVTDDVLEYVMYEILPAGLSDYNGTLLICGTPNETCTGIFHKLSQEDEDSTFTHFHWNVEDNPKFPVWAGKPDWRRYVEPWLKAEREKHGFDENDPRYLREYKGIWIRDTTKMIHHLTDINKLTERPNLHSLDYILGIDTGWSDESAFVVVGYSPIDTKVYHIESIAASHMTFDQLRDTAQMLAEKYEPYGGIDHAVYDPASEGKQIGESLAEELRKRYGIDLKPAEKHNKRNYMLLAETDIRRGYVLMHPHSELWKQASELVWNKQRTREQEGIKCDEYDAWLYAWRECLHWIDVDREPELSVDEQIWADDEEARRQREEEIWEEED